MWIYRLVRPFVAVGAGLVWRIRIRGTENIPDGGFLLAPSHRSMMDIPFAALASRRRVRFMGKSAVFNLPLLGRIFHAMGGVSVERDGSDRAALRKSIEILEAGDIFCVFPEGTRQNGPKIQELQPGAAYLALRAGVPIVPVGLAGTEAIFRGHNGKFPRFGRVAMVIGPAIVPPPREGRTVARSRIDALSGELADRLQPLFDEANALRDQ